MTQQQKSFEDLQIENIDNEYKTENDSTVKSDYLNQRSFVKESGLIAVPEILEDDNEHDNREVAINLLNQWNSPSLKDIGFNSSRKNIQKYQF